MSGKKISLAARFNTLGYHADSQVYADGDHAANDSLPDGVGIDITYKFHVELDVIRLEIHEQGQPGIAGAEIVDGSLETELLVRLEDVDQVRPADDVFTLDRFEDDTRDWKSVLFRSGERAANTRFRPIHGVGHEIDRKQGIHLNACGLSNRCCAAKLVELVAIGLADFRQYR